MPTLVDCAKANLLGQRRGLPLGYMERASYPSFWEELRGLFGRWNSATASWFFLKALRCKVQPPPLRLSGGAHAGIFAAPSSGKTTALIIPALLQDSTPAFVIDPKGEICRAVRRSRRFWFGRRSYVLDPYQCMCRRSDTCDPLSEIDLNDPQAIEEIIDTGNAAVHRSGKENDTHWNDSAELSIAGSSGFVMAHANPELKNLATVQKIVGDATSRTGALEIMMNSKHPIRETLQQFSGQIAQFKERELASVATTTQRHLAFTLSPAISRALSSSSFRMRDVVRGKADLYLILPTDRMRGPQAGFLRLIVSCLARRLFREGVSNSRRLAFYVDEAACLGTQLNALDQLLAVGRGYGARILLAYQSMGQLLASGDEGAAQTLLSCLNCQIFMGAPNDYKTAEYIQNLLGDMTIQLCSNQNSSQSSYQSGTQSGGQDGSSSSVSEGGAQSGQRQRSNNWGNSWSSNSSTSRSSSQSQTYSEAARKLCQASETFSWSPRQALIFLPGRIPPLFTTMPQFFEKKGFARLWSGILWLRDQVNLVLNALTMLLTSVILLACLVYSPQEVLGLTRFLHPALPAHPDRVVDELTDKVDRLFGIPARKESK